MKSRKLTKVISYLLTAAMVVGGISLSPFATVEVRADAPAVKSVNLGTDVLGINVNESNAATVYYGTYPENAAGTQDAPIAWRVIGYLGDGVPFGSGAVLLAAGGVFADQKFDGRNSGYTNHYFDAPSRSSNLKIKMESIADKLTSTEASAISVRTLDDIAGDTVNNAVMWPLSETEAEAIDRNLRRIGSMNSFWWLRSPGIGDTIVNYVDEGGEIVSGGLRCQQSQNGASCF